MSCLRVVMIEFLFAYIFSLLVVFANCDVAMNCGSTVNSTAFDGRKWVGESVSEAYLSGKSRSSTTVQASHPEIDPVPYRTSRISRSEFHYTFRLSPGQKIIRLHFYPTSYRGFETSIDYFSVKAGPFTLLKDYSASLAADTLGVEYIIKEYCLYVGENAQLFITFSPSDNINNVYAFVNAIEIISMPTGLYYTPEGEIGASVVGLSNQFYIIDDSTALEVVHRFNAGGTSITSVEDFGLFRRWDEDSKYLLDLSGHQVNRPILKIKAKNMPALIAPPVIFLTSWESVSSRTGANQMHNFGWKVPVELGFQYLFRFHLCNLDSLVVEDFELREFNVLINNQIAEAKANVMRWSGGTGIPAYQDYVAILKGEGSGRFEVLIEIQAADKSVFQHVHGLEIFKLSDLRNNLAAPCLYPKRMLTFRNPKINNTVAFGRRINVIGTCMTVLLIILSIVVYKVREISEGDFHVAVPASVEILEEDFHVEVPTSVGEMSEENFHVEVPASVGKFPEENFHVEVPAPVGEIPEEDFHVAVPPSVALAVRCFSLVDIKSATQNFSDAFKIGQGGFGKVYKGLIPGIPQMLAIKRLSSFSRQGLKEFQNELEILSKFQHSNIISLIGYCNENGEMILVYEYVRAGSLADSLYRDAGKGKDCALLSWEQRLRICIGIARGLDYIHERGIIHRDMKDTNILLDENFVPKIADFGLSKVKAPTQSQSYISTAVKGTFGYIDPDYFCTGRLTRKSDVYSLGVIMLVVLSGRPAVEFRNQGETGNLVACFQGCSATGDFSKIVDPSLHLANRIREFVEITDKCLQHSPQARPTTIQVIAHLEHALVQHTTAVANFLQQAPPTRSPTTPPHRKKVPNDFVLGSERIARPFQDGSTPKPTESVTSLTQEQHSFSSRVWSWKLVWKRGNKQIPDDIRRFSYETLADATKDFDQGNRLPYYFGSVYKGVLLNGQAVAVRCLSKSPDLKSAMFKNEVVFMSKLQHPCITRLVGCCDERSKRMLVFEYTPNGSLDTYLSDSVKGALLGWNRRKIIIQEIARGLHYLHWSLEVSVIHGDLRLNNIVLDEELKPKIFGIDFARIQQHQQDSITAYVSSTGCDSDYYMAPESFLEGSLSVKSDVYSFGVMLLEIVSGNRERYEHESKNLTLVQWAWKLRSENELIKLVDPGILRADDEWEILRYVNIGLLCVQRDAANRPDASPLVYLFKTETAKLPEPKSQGFYAENESIQVTGGPEPSRSQ